MNAPWRSRWGAVVLLAGLPLLLVTWPDAIDAPSAGLDPSWQAGLAMAWRDGLQYGHDLVFTYGPLGFLKRPQLYDVSAYRLGVLNGLVLRTIAAALVWIVLSRAWGRGWGLLLAAFTLWMTAPTDPAAIIAIAATVLILTDLRRPVSPAVVVALGLLAGFALLGKVNVGVEVALLLGACFCFGPAPRVRNVLVYLGSAAAGLLGVWLIAGQNLGHLPSYVRGAGQIAVGYAPAMSVSTPSLRWAYWVALAGAIVVALAIRSALRTQPRAGAAGLAAVSTIVLFLGFKEGFIREDPGHMAVYFSSVFLLVALVPWGIERRREAVLGLLVATVAFLAGSGSDLASVIHPARSASDLAQTVRLTFRAPERERIVERGRRSMNARYGLQPGVLAQLRGASVQVVPWELGAVWSYRLRWKPLYVFQDYSAYTSYLDGKNAGQLAGGAAPDRVLQQAGGGIDGRLQAWDPPRQQVELLCSWHPVVEQAARWRVLERGPQRCGPARTVAVVKTSWGRAVRVPPSAPDELLTVRVTGVQPSLLESVRSLAWKPAPRFAQINGTAMVRLVAATAGDGLLLRAPASIDPPGPFHKAPGAQTLRFLKDAPKAPQHGGAITLRFDMQRVAPAG